MKTECVFKACLYNLVRYCCNGEKERYIERRKKEKKVGGKEGRKEGQKKGRKKRKKKTNKRAFLVWRRFWVEFH